MNFNQISNLTKLGYIRIYHHVIHESEYAFHVYFRVIETYNLFSQENLYKIWLKFGVPYMVFD